MPHYQAGGPVFVQLGTEVQIDIPFVNIPAEVAAHIDVAEADFVVELIEGDVQLVPPF